MSKWTELAHPLIDDAGNRVGGWLEAYVSEPVERNHARILVAAGALMVAIAGYVNPDTFLNSISAELFGIVIAAVVVDLVNERRQDAERKRILIAQFGSARKDLTEMAIIELRNRGWLYDGTLNDSILDYAALEVTNLSDASLSEVRLYRAKLNGSEMLGVKLDLANLSGAELIQCDMTGANLRDAFLLHTDLRGTRLIFADLTGVFMAHAMLEGTTLDFATLNGAVEWSIDQLNQAYSLRGAVMPDGVQLSADDAAASMYGRKTVSGPSFDEWSLRVIRDFGGDINSVRNSNGSLVQVEAPPETDGTLDSWHMA